MDMSMLELAEAQPPPLGQDFRCHTSGVLL